MKRIAKEDFAQEKKNVGRLIGASTLGMALVLSLAAPARVNAATVTYHACVNNSTGDVIIVTADKACKSGSQQDSVERDGATGTCRAWRTKGSHWTRRGSWTTGATGTCRTYWTARAGGDFGGYAAISDHIIPLRYPTVVAQTAPIETAGWYFISASALLKIDDEDTSGAFWWAAPASTETNDGNIGGSDSHGNQQASITDIFYVSSGDAVQLDCLSNVNDANTFVNNASLTATLINSVSLISPEARGLDAAAVAQKPPHEPTNRPANSKAPR